MRLHKHKAFILALLFAGLVSTLSGETIKAAFIPGLYPFSYLDENGQKTGFYIELLNALAEESGFDVEYISGNWSENFEAGKNADLDLLISVTYTEERTEYLDFLSEMVISNWTQVIKQKSAKIDSILALDNQKVGVMKYDQNGQAFLKFANRFNLKMKVTEYDSFEAMCDAINKGEILAGAIQNFFDISPYSQVERTSIIFNGFSTTFATAKGHNPAFMAALDKQIHIWKTDKESPYHVIFNEYFGLSPKTAIPFWIYSLLFTLAVVSLTAWIIVNSLTRKLRQANTALTEWNITLEMKIEERSKALDESRMLLLQKEKMASLGEMVAGVAHEINTPIGVALTASSFLLDNADQISNEFKKGELSQEEFESFLETLSSSGSMINTNILRASSIIKSFQEISIDQNIEESREINLKNYCEALLVSLSPKIKHSDYSYRLTADDVHVETYPGLIAQIITNLFLNALIHGFEDREKGMIDISLIYEMESKQIIITVKDDGKGISKEIYETMYEPFVSTKRFEGSSGIGLNIVYNIVVQKLNGSIECESKSGEGTKFTVTFPCL